MNPGGDVEMHTLISIYYKYIYGDNRYMHNCIYLKKQFVKVNDVVCAKK